MCVEKLSGQSGRHGNRVTSVTALALRVPVSVLQGSHRFDVGTLLRVAEIVDVVVNGLSDSTVTCSGRGLLLLFLFDRIAGQINGDLVACVGTEQFAVFSGTFVLGPKYEMFFIAGHFVNRQPNTVADHLRFFVFRKPLGQCFAVKSIFAERLDAFDTTEINRPTIIGIVNINGQFAVDHDGVLHFVIAKENDFTLKTANDSLFFSQYFRFPEAGHARGPLRTILGKRICQGEFFLLRNRLRTAGATGHYPGKEQKSEDHQTRYCHGSLGF